MVKRRQHTTIYLPDEMRERLDEAAALSGESRSQFIRRILEAWVRGFDAEILRDIQKRATFAEIGIDALLRDHANPDLRTAVHRTFQERLRRRENPEAVR